MRDTSDITAIIHRWMESFFMRSMRDWTCYVRATGLSLPQFGLLMRLYHGGCCEVHEIGEHFAVTSAAASQLVERLVQAGLVERTENPADRRARQIALTAKGRSLVLRGIEQRHRWVDELASGLTIAERAAVRKALPTLVEAEKRLAGSKWRNTE
jgi:DNA-binding MarR family transcriptional regulator